MSLPKFRSVSQIASIYAAGGFPPAAVFFQSERSEDIVPASGGDIVHLRWISSAKRISFPVNL